MTVSSIPALMAILPGLRPAREGHSNTRTTNATTVTSATKPRNTGPVNDIRRAFLEDSDDTTMGVAAGERPGTLMLQRRETQA